MRCRSLLFLPVLLAVAACSHPLAGNWSQHTGTDAKGMTLEFDKTGTNVFVHTAPRADGGHDHLKGTSTFDDATQAVTVKCKLMGEGKSDTWSGKLDGKHLELASPDGKLTFNQGGEAHGH